MSLTAPEEFRYSNLPVSEIPESPQRSIKALEQSIPRTQESPLVPGQIFPFASKESDSEQEKIIFHHSSNDPYSAHYQPGLVQSYPWSVPQPPWYGQPWAQPSGPFLPPQWSYWDPRVANRLHASRTSSMAHHEPLKHSPSAMVSRASEPPKEIM